MLSALHGQEKTSEETTVNPVCCQLSPTHAPLTDLSKHAPPQRDFISHNPPALVLVKRNLALVKLTAPGNDRNTTAWTAPVWTEIQRKPANHSEKTHPANDSKTSDFFVLVSKFISSQSLRFAASLVVEFMSVLRDSSV
ncbi:Hypothetical predicted protein [Scomber scombrus]|uniref:Uncharacterized protein n=1 Tax=Scomber scombrus TaxID=13677 RepID=A0AAV1N1F9_SCOSC